MSYPCNCNVCRQKIWMRPTPRAGWQPFEPWGGRHRHWSAGGVGDLGGVSRSAQPQFPIENSRRPLTYPTSCWWCGCPVYFHTNGYGDSVLFDALGKPWTRHHCWETHVNDRRVQISRVDAAVNDAGFRRNEGGGIVCPLNAVRIECPRRSTCHRVKLAGFAVRPEAIGLPAATTPELGLDGGIGDWTELLVHDREGNLYPLLVPCRVAETVKDFSLVNVAGRWLRRRTAWLLVATRLTTLEFPTMRSFTKNIAKIGKTADCYYCQRRIGMRSSWRFDEHHRLQCARCAASQGTVTSNQFLRLVRRIAHHRLRMK